MAKAENIVTSITVEIDVPAALVWEVLTDLPNYATWNSFCPGIESTLRIGDPVRMQVRVPGTDRTEPVHEYLVAFEPEQLLSWEQYPVPENKDAARRDQYIQALGPNRCSYFTTDIFLGVNADKIMAEHGAWVKEGFDNVARDLKRYAEALYTRRARIEPAQ
ncbi:SRPBCC domain-containing protein [Aromatoleum anaerobium]|uniref:SRPBCC domain-containing protein n=1 Tax=Aromatoleum anaerobium TaxID=182180 RepID=A0ABX1PKU2_9RHOO|nr:SRPBCC domain-containing protein [Aromatoleum anaerobium]MCK0508139.1 SRPBCC domain-containing protein [Aromatoleum anaerobium]